MIIHVKKNIAMKKIYQNPEITVVKMLPTQMIATSMPKCNDEGTNETSGNAAKGGWNLWSDEPEEVDY